MYLILKALLKFCITKNFFKYLFHCKNHLTEMIMKNEQHSSAHNMYDFKL